LPGFFNRLHESLTHCRDVIQIKRDDFRKEDGGGRSRGYIDVPTAAVNYLINDCGRLAEGRTEWSA
jgi:hypothetical protein